MRTLVCCDEIRSESRRLVDPGARGGATSSKLRPAERSEGRGEGNASVSPGGAALASREVLKLVPLEELFADHHPLDLGGALPDEQERCVPVQPLDLVLLGVA